MTCDNFSSCHTPITIGEDNNASRVMCTTCKEQYVLRKDYRGVHFNRQYSEIFKKEILQGHENLFYKYYPQHLKR